MGKAKKMVMVLITYLKILTVQISIEQVMNIKLYTFLLNNY